MASPSSPPLSPLSSSSSLSSSGPALAAADLLSAALSDADRRDRETMNLKMEIAHLRERLLLRVGGDASAAALEAETFALKTALTEAQQNAARAQQALQSLDGKYAKALRNLVKMDHAWKSSAAELALVKKEAVAREALLRQRTAEIEQLTAKHEDDAAKRQTLATYQEEKIQGLDIALRAKDAALASHMDQLHTFTLKTKELESELEATRRRHESSSQQHVARDEFEALQTRHQATMEATATLRGETNALRNERASLQSQLSDTKASLTAAMAKFLQLKEENATLEVRMAAAQEQSVQSARDAEFYKNEVDRIQHELTKRDEEMLQLERGKQVVELQLAQHQRLVDDAVQVRDHEARRLELKQELTWKDREFALENDVRALKKQCQALEDKADAVRALHDELCEMLRGACSGAADSTGSHTEVAGQALKTLVAQAAAELSEAAFTAEQQQKQLVRLEKELARTKALVEENVSLKAEYEKTRLAMERIVGRKSKATANTQRFANGATTTSTSAVGGFRGTSSSTTTTPAGATASAASAKTSLSSVTLPRRLATDKDSNHKETATTSTAASAPASAFVGTKRKLDLPTSREPGNRTPTKADAGGGSGTIFSPRSKRVVHVASRYLQATKR